MQDNTRDFEDFGIRERGIACDLLSAWNRGGLPEEFVEDRVAIEFNPNSDCVFLVNSEYQVAMLNDDDELELWHVTPYEGREGFMKDLVSSYKTDGDIWDEEDIQYLRDYGALEDK